MMDTHPLTVDALASLYPFAGVDGQRLNQLLPLCRRERFRQSIDPFRQRDWRGQIIYLMQGELKIKQADGVVRVLVGGSGRALFPVAQSGQMPLCTKALTDIELLRIEEEASDIVVTWDQCAARSLEPCDHRFADWPSISGMFAVHALTRGAFSSLPSAHIATLLERFQRKPFKRGDVVVRQGEAGDFYYLIEQGQCLVTRDVAGTVLELAELKAGDAFGEEALVSGSPRNATVTMASDGSLLMLRKAEFDALLSEPLLVRCPPAEAIQRTARGAVWLDVRLAAEYQHDGLPSAINVPLNELRNVIPLLDEAREYIVYCQTGRRSAAAAFLLSQRGLNVAVLDGGLRGLTGTTGKERG